MTSDDIKQIWHKRPFEPFTVVMSSGERYQVSDPENATLTKGALIVTYRSTPAEVELDKFAICSLLHIAAIDVAAAERN